MLGNNSAQNGIVTNGDAQAELAYAFSPTNDMGNISVDSNNNLFMIREASADIKKKTGALAMTGKVLAATYTLGASVAIEKHMKKQNTPSDRIFRFDELRGFELLEDDSSVVSGGIGAALVGGAFFGGFGALAGAKAGSRKTKKAIDNLVLKINLTDLDFPSVMITYINKTVKTSSNTYRKAVGDAQNTISCLELILEQVEAEKKDSDPIEQLKKLKELVDLGVITQAEFEMKKDEIIG